MLCDDFDRLDNDGRLAIAKPSGELGGHRSLRRSKRLGRRVRATSLYFIGFAESSAKLNAKKFGRYEKRLYLCNHKNQS